MAPRLQLQALLEAITDRVYFQPPINLRMVYPCIVYIRDYAKSEFADNSNYHRTLRYSVTVVDKDPDSLIPGKVAVLPLCSFNRFYVADNLNHDVFSLFF